MIPVYVIHLPDEKRKARISAELARVGFHDVFYVYAREPMQGFTCNNMRRNPRGEFGCAMSHIKAMVYARRDHVGKVLFVEDDVEFIGEPILTDESVDILYFGGHPRGHVERTHVPNLFRVRNGFSFAEAYVMQSASIPAFLGYWCDRAGQKNALFDIILGEWASTVRGCAVYPLITRQPPGWSHIGEKHDDKSELVAKAWAKHLPA